MSVLRWLVGLLVANADELGLLQTRSWRHWKTARDLAYVVPEAPVELTPPLDA